MSHPPEPPAKITAVALVFEGGLAGLALAFGALIGQPPWRGLEDWSGPQWSVAAAAGWGAAATIPLLVGLLLVDRFPLGPLRSLRELVVQRVAPLFSRMSWAELACISLAAGIGEEMLFRGVLQRALTGWWGPPGGVWLGLAVASAAFGLCHWLSPMYALLAGLTGLYLGALMLAAGDQLAAPIVAHALYDFLALAYLVKLGQPAAPPT